MRLTEEQIAKQCEDKDGVENIKAINALYRQQDESNLWPIRGKFNCTERAIRRVRRYCQCSGAIYGLEYAYAISQAISDIVNDSNNE